MHDDHDRVHSLVAALRDQLGSDGPACAVTFARLRWSLTSDLLRHMALERLLLSRLQNTRDLRERCDQDERTFREHVARWPACAMQTRWHEYRSEFTAVLRLIEARLQFEQARRLTAAAPVGEVQRRSA
ncbi:hypothetical protein SAMN05216382_1126 [Sphingomonas palmae]|uniref:Hemerythrin HHE cation binding domain-containing protein n=2 Tax=Sphingomonas palmae TaxID=1855283 RepID=A0A1H7L193_9SPHN|nr:hypothetical protein SAMN05216382_1126 [Sphingomonas palmae]